jgi:hypothetical protein
MKHNAMLLGLALFLALPTGLAAQDQPPPPPPPYQQGPPPPPVVQNGPASRDHGEVGAYADYFRFNPSGIPAAANFVGVGGRVGVNMHRHIALEAELNYDFARNFTTTFNNGITSVFYTSSVRPLTGLFGPTFQIGSSGPVRAFATGKVGFIDFSVNTSGVTTGGTFTTAVAGVGGSGTHVAFYPGGGVEMFAGLLGLRVEAGDEIYLNNGTYNNLRVTAGPVFRF